MAKRERPHTLAAIDRAIHACCRCSIGYLDNVAVMGEGPADARLMIVGEQPGDQEDRQGRPFVGPAGRVLDEHLAEAGIDRDRAYVTNAVKHFKYAPRGKRRLHQKPTTGEIDICRWWLESEIEVIKPRLVLAMGTSAAQAMLGKPVTLAKARGKSHPLADGREVWVTTHPSYLLRLRDRMKEEQDALFKADLAKVAKRLKELA